jgi:prolyl 4-hydroxylase
MTKPASHSPSESREGEDMFAAAVRLISDRPPPDELQRAVALLEEALAKGYNRAGERLAAFHAMAANGTGDPARWEQSFDFLQRAAEQGSAAAGKQLLLLADNSHEPLVAPEIQRCWDDVRSRIRIERLLAPPVRKSLSDSPRIRLLEGFATAAECRWIVEAAREHLAPATVFNPTTGELVLDPARDNAAVSLMFEQMNVVSEVLRTRISAATRVPVPAFEPSQILRYHVGQQFIPHYDFMDEKSAGLRHELGGYGQRIATFLIYLNDDYGGGETNFPKVGLNYRGRTGDAIFWANLDTAGRPDPLTLHAGLPPTSGEKWVFSQWIREKLAPPAG